MKASKITRLTFGLFAMQWLALTLLSLPVSAAHPASATTIFSSAHYLNPNTGRFWTMDSYEGDTDDPISLHKYLYVHDDPLNGIDPSGLELLDDLGDIPLTLGGGHSALRLSDSLESARLYNNALSSSHAGAAWGRGLVELNPIVGLYNNGYQLLSGNDAIDSSKHLTGLERAKSGGGVVLAAVPFFFRAGKFINLARTTIRVEEGMAVAIKLADGAAPLVKGTKNSILLGVLEKGNVRLFETVAGKVEGHSDLVKAGIVSKEAQGFSIGVKNGEVVHFFRHSGLNTKLPDRNLPLGQVKQILEQIGTRSVEVFGN